MKKQMLLLIFVIGCIANCVLAMDSKIKKEEVREPEKRDPAILYADSFPFVLAGVGVVLKKKQRKKKRDVLLMVCWMKKN